MKRETEEMKQKGKKGKWEGIDESARDESKEKEEKRLMKSER